ncbi:hypothetical protein D9758_007650 [Tetrapyrgos nigripes]|uniref:Protein kinase domain-containing protein n=1 Tax=Tetrapyrgos nigripes TaxID=182062 RepID=A0A8H5G841_9AGAR|nr:hypothetical protein D9758_007650 [Tetrapyrgos nigripes]
MRAASFAGVVPRTPPRSSPHAQTQVMSTPLARGSSSQVDLADNHKVADINTYLEEDIKDRVHLDLEIFLKLVLDFGDAERKKETKINNVMKNENFERVWNYYRGLCGLGSTTEKELYEPLLKVIETAMKRLFPNQQPFTHFNGGDKFILGSYARRKPDLPAVRRVFGLDRDTAKDTQVHWPMVEPFGELKLTPKQGGKRTGFALDWGDATPGETPQAVTAPATQNRYNLRSRSASGGSLPNAFPTQSHTRSLHPIPETSTHTESKNEEVEAGKKNKKKGNKGTKQKKKTLGDEMEPEEENLLTKPSDRRLHTLLQCAGYGLESLSSGLLRTHTVGFVMDGTFFQLCYYDRSKVVLSKPVDLSEPNSMFLFLATLYQLGSLPDEKQGIFPSKGDGKSLPTLEPSVNERYTRREGGNYTSGPITGESLLFPGGNAFSGCKMTVGKEVFHLGELVHRAHAIIGRGTTVVRVKWNDKDAIMKLSFCGAERTPEEELVKSARAKATEEGHDWALNHLPNILYSAEYNLAGLAEDRLATYFEQQRIPYERRVLRITVQDVLTPITDAVLEPKDYAQIFFDVLQIHRWLVDHAKILHRDISMTNIMFREKDGKIYGVLNDFDLSSRLPPESKASSRQRTGTKPYMSHELLNPSWVHGHRYRHDLESLFYVILIFCSDYGAKGEEDKLVKVMEPHFQKWFTGSFEDVRTGKISWLLDDKPLIQVTEFFRAFGLFYLDKLRNLVNKGHRAKNDYTSAWGEYKNSEKEHKEYGYPFTQVFTETFEWETLNDTVTYEKFRDVMKSFPVRTSSGKWQPFQLAMHYEDPLPLNPSDFGLPPDNDTLV